MKYAICYRGISYKENYFNEPGLDSYNVDFFDCIFYNEKYLINPLRDNGNDVDIFFNTYDSKKLNQYIDKLNPIDIRITELIHK